MTRFGRGVVAAGTALAMLVLLAVIGQLDRAVLGGVAGLLLATALWALTWDRHRWLAVGVATAAVPVVGVLLLVGAGGAIVAQFRTTEPVGTVLLVGAAGVAALGVGATIGAGLKREIIGRTVGIAAPTIAVPGIVLSVLAVARFVPVGREASTVLGEFLGVILDPAAGQVHLAVWSTLAVAAVYAAWSAVDALPVSELRATDAEGPLSRVTDYGPILLLMAALAIVAMLAAEGIGRPYAGLPGGLRSVLAALTGSPGLRLLFCVTLVASGVIVGLTTSVRRGYRASGGRLLAAVAPFAVALGVTWWALNSGDTLVEELRGTLARELPAAAADPVLSQFDMIVEFYGADLLAVTLLVVTSIVGAVVVILLYVAVATGRVPDRAGGPAMAAAGVFATAGITVVQGAPLVVGLFGTVASIVVWDSGSFATGIVDELGSGVVSTRPELVHAGATAVVGVLASLVALSLSGILSSASMESAVVPALLGAVVGALFLVFASR